MINVLIKLVLNKILALLTSGLVSQKINYYCGLVSLWLVKNKLADKKIPLCKNTAAFISMLLVSL
ncbi:hypothetical protein PA25_10220 [Pseudoalteromonas sp. A25]|nr:hypothetical protein PA25_10220 [Pseudoalteromonas sp. A25]